MSILENQGTLGSVREVDFEHLLEMASSLLNDVLSPDSEASFFREFREKSAIALPAIKTRISDINEDIKKLKNEQHALRMITTLASSDVIFSPIRHVPLDIIREIMQYSLPLQPEPNRNDAPLSLGRVCSAWRAATLSSPQLWAALFLEMEPTHHFPRYAKLVEEWFKRAGGFPLIFVIHFTSGPGGYDTDIAQPFRELLQSFAPIIPRVRRLEISAPWVGDIFPVLAHMDPDWVFQSLERLDLSNTAEDSRVVKVENSLLPDIFNQAPLLRRLSMYGPLYVETPGSSSIIPWSQLTYVHLSEWLPVGHWIDIVELCSLMQIGIFRVVVDMNWEEPPSQGAGRQHPHLEILSLDIHNDPGVVDVLKLFNLPNLRSLEVRNTGKRTQEVQSLKNHCQLLSLRTLILRYCRYSTSYLTQVLSEASNLEELILDPYQIDDPLLECLTNGPTSSSILPRLAALKIFSSFLPEFVNMGTFVDMINSRCHDVPEMFQPLKELRITLHTRSGHLETGELEQILKLYAKKGLPITIVEECQTFSSKWWGLNYYTQPFGPAFGN